MVQIQVTIPQIPPAASVSPSDKIEIDQNGVSHSATLSQLVGAIGVGLFFTSAYQTLTAADNAASAAGGVLFVNDSHTLTGDFTFFADVQIAGGIITRGSHNLTFNGSFFAPPEIIAFDAAGTGLVSFSTLGNGTLSTIWFGVVGDGATDDTNAMTQAFAAAVSSNTIEGNNLVSKITSTISLRPGIRLKNIGMDHYPPDNTTDLLAINGDNYSPSFDAIRLDNCMFRAQQGGWTFGRDLIRINRGDHIQMKNVYIRTPVRDGLHVEPDASGNWVENMTLENVKVQSAGRDSFRLYVPDTLTNIFINQTTMIECESRAALGSAISFMCDNTIASANKISATNLLNCELGVTGAVSTPIVNIQGSASAGVIENLRLDGCATEDTSSSRTGFGIVITGKCSGMFIFKNGIIFGTPAGRISGLQQFPFFEVNTGSTSDNVFRSHAGIVEKYRTASLAVSGTETIDYILNASEILDITVLDRFSTGGWYGRWTVFGITAVPPIGTPVNCSLAIITVGSGKQLQITNNSASTAVMLEVFIRRLVADTAS